MSAIVTRTTNPLPFQDLEPKRFEDLVRQLAYDFRTWTVLEATGRAGSDHGFDARGIEAVETSMGFQEQEDEEVPVRQDGRLWLVQCKRERVIGPTKAVAHLEDIIFPAGETLYGIIFAAACDFSKASRDAILNWCRGRGIQEVHVWGRGELEDMLFQPKNDHLLFAYFGISLTVRRRAQAADIRAQLAVKRQLKKTVTASSTAILIRDPTASEYPVVEEGDRPSRWWVYQPEELSHLGLVVSVAWYYAFINRENGEWDAAEAVSAMPPHHPWRIQDVQTNELRHDAARVWDSFPQENRGWLQLSGIIPYGNIIAIDEMGDDVFEGVHVYAPFFPDCGPFKGGFWEQLAGTSVHSAAMNPDPGQRIERFPQRLRHPAKRG